MNKEENNNNNPIMGKNSCAPNGVSITQLDADFMEALDEVYKEEGKVKPSKQRFPDNNKYFRLEWFDWEESWNEVFYHPNKTKESFKMDAQLLMRKYGDEFIASNRGYISMVGLLIFISDKMPELGYSKLEPVTSTFSGGNILTDDDSDEDGYEKWVEIIGERLAEKISNENKKISDEMTKGYDTSETSEED
jgi:hypothetical protein